MIEFTGYFQELAPTTPQEGRKITMRGKHGKKEYMNQLNAVLYIACEDL